MNDSLPINACCLNRFCCELGGKPRPEMPCGFEMCATVEGCPKAARLQGDIVSFQHDEGITGG